VTTLLASGFDLPEGPAFAPDGTLWWVEVRGGNLVRFDDGTPVRIPTGGQPNGLAFDAVGLAWICDSGLNAIRCYDPAAELWQTRATHAAGQLLAGPNDLAFDAAGNLVFTCPGDSRREPSGVIGCLRPNGKVEVVARGLYFPNGLAFADDGRTLIVAETYRQRLWRGGWNANEARWLDPQPWAVVGGQAGPDGLAIAADGHVYAAVYGTGEVRVVNSSGQIVGRHPLPGRNPTNLAFTPSKQHGLVVTEAEHGQVVWLPGIGPGVPLFAGSRNMETGANKR
jgi:gluconolactonase